MGTSPGPSRRRKPGPRPWSNSYLARYHRSRGYGKKYKQRHDELWRRLTVWLKRPHEALSVLTAARASRLTMNAFARLSVIAQAVAVNGVANTSTQPDDWTI